MDQNALPAFFGQQMKVLLVLLYHTVFAGVGYLQVAGIHRFLLDRWFTLILQSLARGSPSGAS
jgi:hypothetical protein